jgi:hypothetical protein
MSNVLNKIATKAAFTQVADVATSAALLAANGARVGASFVNTSSARLYIRFDGGTVSSANHSVSLAQGARFDLPFAYNGAITGIWASDPGDGAANITEYTN